jgi:hypothetical protein
MNSTSLPVPVPLLPPLLSTPPPTNKSSTGNSSVRENSFIIEALDNGFLYSPLELADTPSGGLLTEGKVLLFFLYCHFWRESAVTVL